MTQSLKESSIFRVDLIYLPYVRRRDGFHVFLRFARHVCSPSPRTPIATIVNAIIFRQVLHTYLPTLLHSTLFFTHIVWSHHVPLLTCSFQDGVARSSNTPIQRALADADSTGGGCACERVRTHQPLAQPHPFRLGCLTNDAPAAVANSRAVRPAVYLYQHCYLSRGPGPGL